MKVSLISDDKNLAYNSFLRNQKGAMIFYSLKFKSFLEKQTNSRAMYFVAIDENENIQGILPLMVKEGKYGKVLNSLPYYGTNGGILANIDEAKEILISKYLELINSGEYAAATLIENPLNKEFPYERIAINESDFRIGQLTNMAGSFVDLEDIMLKYDSKTRNIIRKAIKSDVKVTIENNQFEFLRHTHFENMASIGGLAKEASFFENVEESFEAGVDYDIYVARIGEIPIAAMLIFYFGKVVEYYTPVIVKEYRSYQPLSLLISTAMFNASKLGYEWWNWGGTWSSQGGVYDFKSKWGTEDKNYAYYISIFNKELYSCSKEELLNEYSGFYVLPFDKLRINDN